jgi:galactosyl transferase GMA12/MNN10 family
MIKIITGCDHSRTHAELAEICKFTIKRYCRLHGLAYSFHTITETEVPAPWYKIQFLLKEFEQKKTRYCFWMDVDSLIINPDFRIRSLIREKKELYLSEDCNGVNSGVMLWENTLRNRKFLKRTWKMRHRVKHCWAEQEALRLLILKNHGDIQDKIEWIPQKILNAYDYTLYGMKRRSGQVEKDSFIVHFPGLDFDIRKAQMESYLHQAWKPTSYQLALSRLRERFRK